MLKKQIVFIIALCAMQLTYGMQDPNNGFNDLCSAALHGKPDDIKQLIACGADVNARGDDGETVLMSTAILGNEAVCKLLIQMGADLNAQDRDGCTALIYVAIAEEKPAIFQLLIDAGADVNLPDTRGWTPLMRSVSDNRLKSMRQLLEAGANCNAADRRLETALMVAVQYSSIAVCELLLQYGADPEMRDNEGMSALSLCAASYPMHDSRTRRRRFEPIVQLLNDPLKIHAVIMREDNPNLKSLRRFGPNICSALMFREMGRK